MDEARIEAAEVEFHDALDLYEGHTIGHSHEDSWVDDRALAVVEALLNAGWLPPSEAKQLRD